MFNLYDRSKTTTEIKRKLTFPFVFVYSKFWNNACDYNLHLMAKLFEDQVSFFYDNWKCRFCYLLLHFAMLKHSKQIVNNSFLIWLKFAKHLIQHQVKTLMGFFYINLFLCGFLSSHITCFAFISKSMLNGFFSIQIIFFF